MKKIGFMMNLYMSISLSFFLTITGECVGMLPNIITGRVPVQALIMGIITGFVISFVISMIIGTIIPVHKITESATKNMNPGLGKHLMQSFLSDIIYTPLISVCMVAFAYFNIDAPEGRRPTYLEMLVPSLIACLIVAYVMIIILQPRFIKRLMKKYGGPQGGPPEGKPPVG